MEGVGGPYEQPLASVGCRMRVIRCMHLNLVHCLFRFPYSDRFPDLSVSSVGLTTDGLRVVPVRDMVHIGHVICDGGFVQVTCR